MSAGMPTGSSQVAELTPRTVPQEGELTGAEAHVYSLHPESGDYLHLIVEQRGIDVVVTLFDPDGEPLLEVDSPVGVQDPESLHWVASASDRHRLEVRLSSGPPHGRYRIRMGDWRAARPPDYDRAAAAKARAAADGHRRGSDIPAALEGYQRAARLWGSSGETLQQAFALYWAGLMQTRLGETRASIESLERSLALYRESGRETRDVASILSRLAQHSRTLGELGTSLSYLKRALHIARKLRDPRREASYLHNIALSYKLLGRPQQSLSYYLQALALWQELGNPAEESKTRANLGALYSFLGELDHARDQLEHALRLSQGRRRAEARVLGSLGAIQRRLGRLDESLTSLQRFLHLQQELQERRGQAVAYKELARTYFELGRYESAFEAGEQALALFRDNLYHKGEGEVLCDLGWFHNELEDSELALSYFTLGLETFKLARSRSGEASALYGAALALRRRDLVAAHDRIEQALDIVESLRNQIGRGADFLERLEAGDDDILALRSSFLAERQDYYELGIDILIDLHESDPTAGYDSRALKASERRRARNLLDILTDAVQGREGDSDTPLESLLGRAPPLGLEEIRQLLDEETFFLEYTLGKARSFLWLVSPTELWYHQLPGRAEIEWLSRDVHGLLSQVRGRKGRGQLTQRSRELSELLLGPVAERLRAKRLLVVGDEVLQYIPFAALPIPEAHPEALSRAPGTPMVMEHEIIQLPSASVLAMLRKKIEARVPAPRLIAVVADPVFDTRDPRVKYGGSDDSRTADPGPPHSLSLGRLPGSGVEAEAILAFVPEHESLAALGFDANLDLVRQGTLADYRFVHFATHGLFRHDFSGLLLSQVDAYGQWREGLLLPHVVYGLDLPVEMVVLSACRSGLGKEVRGEGLVGLTQSFLYAGAARVMVSLWRVDDLATACLMERFYRGVFEDGLRPAAALRSAQLSMLSEGRWAAPYHWAGFFLQGEWR